MGKVEGGRGKSGNRNRVFFFSSRRRHTRYWRDWSSDVCSSDLEIAFQTKPQIALTQIRAALVQGVSPGVVLADAGYGADMDFQEGLLTLGLLYVVGARKSVVQGKSVDVGGRRIIKKKICLLSFA